MDIGTHPVGFFFLTDGTGTWAGAPGVLGREALTLDDMVEMMSDERNVEIVNRPWISKREMCRRKRREGRSNLILS